MISPFKKTKIITLNCRPTFFKKFMFYELLYPQIKSYFLKIKLLREIKNNLRFHK